MRTLHPFTFNPYALFYLTWLSCGLVELQEVRTIGGKTHKCKLSPSPCTLSPRDFFFGGGGSLFRAEPMAYGSSQVRGQIGATAASLCHSHSNAGSKLCL